MIIPTISQYSHSIANPTGLFRTLAEPLCECNAYGEPRFTAGGNAAVFKIYVNGNAWALKCYTRPETRRTEDVCRYFSRNNFPIAYPMRYLPKEIYVYDACGSGNWHDILLSEWAEGATLDYEIRKALHYEDRSELSRLARNFDLMATELLSMPWAHGDLKPLNIIVEPSGRMRPIDYDAVFYPEADNNEVMEKGTPQYNHPARAACLPGKFIDDYPVALISSTLHALALEPSLASRFGSADTFLFEPSELIKGNSPGYETVKEMAARAGDAKLHRLLSLLAYPDPALPELQEILNFPSSVSSCSLCSPSSLQPFRNRGKWGYLRNGETFIAPLFDNALEFTEGMALVSLEHYRHFIDCGGKTVINCSRYDAVKPFAGGCAAVRRNRQWGYIDLSGKEVIEPVFLSATSFRGGRARVTAPNGDTLTITISGPLNSTVPFVIEPSFSPLSGHDAEPLPSTDTIPPRLSQAEGAYGCQRR